YAIMTQAPTINIITGLSSNPLFAVPLQLGSATNSIRLANPFPAGTGISLGPFAINPNFDNSYAQDWNLTIQRQVTSTLGIEVAYVGVKGTHLQFSQNINQPFVTNRSEEHTSELQSLRHLVCRLLLEKKKKKIK